MEKIKRNFVLAVLTAIVFLSAMSCKKNNVTTIKTDNKFAISLLGEDTITIFDVFNIVDTSSTWNSVIHVYENGELYYVYVADTVKGIVSGEKLLTEIKDITVLDTNVCHVPALTIPQEMYDIRALLESGGGVSPVPFSYEFKMDTVLTIPDFPNVSFEVENFTIIRALMQKGLLDFCVNVGGLNDEVTKCYFTIESPNIIDESGTFSSIILNHDNLFKNLAGCAVVPEHDSLCLNARMRVVIPSVTFDQDNTTLSYFNEYMGALEAIGGEHVVDYNGLISNLAIESVEGIVNVPSIRYGGVYDDIEFKINLEGDLQINKPNTFVKYLNTFNFGVEAAIDTMLLHSKGGTYTDVLKTDEITLTLESTPSYKDADITGEIIDFIDVLGDYDRFAYAGEVRIDNEDAISVHRDSHVDIATMMELKLGMKINELVYRDTLDMSMGDVTVKNLIEEFDFKFDLTNDLPFELVFQAYLIGNNGVVTDSLFDETNNRIPSSYGGDPVSVTNIVKVTDERLDNVLHAKKMIYKVAVSTGGHDVVLKASDMIVVSVGVMTKTSEIDVNDVL